MMIQLELGPEFKKTIAELGGLGDAVALAASTGLGKAVKFSATHVISKYLTGQALRTRSGMLKKAVDGWMVSDFEGVVGVQPNSAVDKYKWLLGEESKTIVPTKGKFLAIPIGENLTGAGVAKFTSPRQVPNGFFIRVGGRLLFGYKNGKKGKFRAMFTLVKSVFVQGSGALADGVLESTDNMSGIIKDEVEKVL
jgi:hypothetical protein